MKLTIVLPALLSLALPLAAAAQDTTQPAPPEPASDTAVATAAAVSMQPSLVIQHMRPNDKRGLYIFESPKNDDVPYTGFRLNWGAAFTQQFQSLSHTNTASPKLTGPTNVNQLMEIGAGFNNAAANLYLNAQLAPGIRVALTTYLSSKHHQEVWVKDGYLLIDESPIDNTVLKMIMAFTTLRVGHFEVNYGDAHFRRTDNGNALQNPFVGNLIMDAFTTEIGAETYLRAGPFMVMGGLTGGEVKGSVQTPKTRGWSKLAKVGFDQQVQPNLRVRLTGSMYTTGKSVNNTLYSGDRAGSRYNLVLENTLASTVVNAWSGAIQPGFKNEIRAYQINPFIKVRALEVFGVIEHASGKATAETSRRAWNQYAVDGIYRLLNEKLFVGGRYNTANGALAGVADKVSVDRFQGSAGWYITPSVLMKGEYVKQKYNDFPLTDIRNGGKFDGFVMEGIVSF